MFTVDCSYRAVILLIHLERLECILMHDTGTADTNDTSKARECDTVICKGLKVHKLTSSSSI